MIPRPFKPSSRRLTLAKALLPILPVLPLWGCSSDTQPGPTDAVRPAYVVEARAGGTQGLGFVGEVRAARRAELAFAVAGRVARVAVEVGDTVQRGQILATLDAQPLAAQLAAAQGELSRVEAQVAELRQRHERVRRAQLSGAVSGGEMGAVQAELAAAEAAQRTASGQRDTAAWSLEQATLRAPLDGTVATRLVEPGQASGPGAPVIAIDGTGRELAMLLPAALPLKPGQAVTLRQGTVEQASRVLRVAGRLEAGGVRRIFLDVPGDAAVGSTWTAVLADGQPATALQVPLRAVLPDATAGSGRVLRLAKDGATVEQVAVKLGALHGVHIDVTQGLVSGDRVVVAGASGIRVGSRVKPVAYKLGNAGAEVQP